jgi:hypothetical protein
MEPTNIVEQYYIEQAKTHFSEVEDELLVAAPKVSED